MVGSLLIQSFFLSVADDAATIRNNFVFGVLMSWARVHSFAFRQLMQFSDRKIAHMRKPPFKFFPGDL